MGPPDSHQLTAIDTLYRIGGAVNETDEPREALTLILDEIIACTNATSASIALINPDSNKLEIEAYKGLPIDQDGYTLSIGQGITGWVALHGKPLIANDVDKEPRYIEIAVSIRSEMAVPMQVERMRMDAHETVTIGVVNVNSEKKDAFTDQDLKLLTLITQEATRVVNRMWLIKHLKEKAVQLESLIKVGQQLVKKLDLQEILDSITQQARILMNCRLCALFLLNKDRTTLKLHSLSGPEAESLKYEEELNVEESSVGVVVQRNKQVAIYDLPMTEEHHFIQLTQSEHLRSLLSTPITVENKVIGVLNAYTDTHHRFNNAEKDIFATLAALGSVAIQNTNLYARVFTSEEILRKNERLTTLGLLAAEIAHEVRNPLTVIKLLFDSLRLDFGSADPRQQDVEMIREKIKQLEEIVGNVLSFGKSDTDLHARWALNTLIEDVLKLVRLKMNQSKVEVVYQPAAENIVVAVHKGQIQQVLLNLLLNALQAMPAGGRICIAVKTGKRANAPQAIITVNDSGSGIQADIRNQIFDNFLTSKRDGTGLGLSISKQIMKQHRGNISLVESSERGTTFELTLPVHA